MPPPRESVLGDCAMAGEAHVVSPRAFVQSGVEAVSVPGAIALGFAVDPRNGVAVTVDPASIGITTTVKSRALGGDARRMSPVLERGKLTLVPGVDKKFDKLQGRRVVGTNPSLDLGVAEGSLVWAPHDQNSYAKLFPLEGEGAVEAIRAVPLGSTKGIAFAFRRGNAVYVGVAKGDAALTAEGSLSRIAGLGQVGSPSITTSGDSDHRRVVRSRERAGAVAGALDQAQHRRRPGRSEAARASRRRPRHAGHVTERRRPRRRKLRHGVVGGTPSPSGARHHAQAPTAPLRPRLALSAAGVNAGQPQVAVGPDGRGRRRVPRGEGQGLEIHATPVACAAK